MAYEILDFRYTLPAAADLSALQYTAVLVDANGKASAAGVDARCDGILQNKPNAAGKSATVVKSGISKMVASGTVTAGDDVSLAAGGTGKTAASGKRRVGVALTTATGPALFSILLSNDGVAP